jgi:hypothetical protein
VATRAKRIPKNDQRRQDNAWLALTMWASLNATIQGMVEMGQIDERRLKLAQRKLRDLKVQSDGLSSIVQEQYVDEMARSAVVSAQPVPE